MKHWYCVVSMLIMSVLAGYGQDVNNSRLLDEMKKLQRIYNLEGSLSFDIEYRYATEKQPKIYLDSMKGNVDIKGRNFRLVLSNTESIKCDNYLIHVFSEDNLIYISKSNISISENPLALLDSALANIPGLTSGVEEVAGSKIITMNFPRSHAYKTITFLVNKATGFISKINYVVRSGELMSGVEDDSQGEYAIIESNFFNYSKRDISPSLFDEKTYFSLEGTTYKPTAKYNNYSIFLGSPNL